MTVHEVRSHVLQFDYFVENEWLDKYISIIAANAGTERVPKVTQRHHIVPVSCFKHRGIDVDNSDRNTVNLSYKDHMEAHLYLSGCTKGRERYQNLYAVFQMSHFDKEGYRDIQNYTCYEELYSAAISAAPNHRKGSKVSIATVQRMRDAQLRRIAEHGPVNIDTCWVNDGLSEKMVKRAELQQYLDAGYVSGRLYRHSSETLDKISESGRRRQITPEFREKMREVGRLSNIGRDPESYRRQGQTLKKYYQTHANPFKGKQHSRESVAANRAAHVGRKKVHKDGIVKCIKPDELQSFLDAGWELGQGIWYGNQYSKKKGQ